MRRVLAFFLVSAACAVWLIGFLAAPANAAFVAFFDGTTLTVTQTFDDGAITIDDNGAGGAIRVIDGAGTVTFVATTHLVVNLLDSTGNQLDIDLDSAHSGNVTLNLGDGARTVNFTGTSNSIGGDLVINGGTGNQTVELAINANPSVTGSMSISLGDGFDLVDENAFDVSVGGNVTFNDVNLFENNGTMDVTGNVLFDTQGDTTTGELDNDTVMTIGGNLTYEGNDLGDTLNFNAMLTVTGNVVGNVRGGGPHNFNINNPAVDIGGSVTLTSTGAAMDDLNMVAGLTIGGDVSVDFADGVNNADFQGTFSGAQALYQGGSGVDTILVNQSATGMDMLVLTEGGADPVTLGASADLASLFVDLGCGGADTFTVLPAPPAPPWVTVVNDGVCVPAVADLSASKFAAPAGPVAIGAPIDWTVAVANGGIGDSLFFDGEVVLLDALPAGAIYSDPKVDDAINVTGADRISCEIVSLSLSCSATGPAGLIVGGSGGLGGGSFDVSVTATPTAAGSLTNFCLIDPDDTIAESNELNNGCESTVVVEPAPEFSKVFAPDSIAVAEISTLTFTINNTASALAATGLTFTDILPDGIDVADPPNASTTCAGGAVTAAAGTDSIELASGSVVAGASCTVTVDVIATKAGVLVNTSGALTSSGGNSGTAQDALIVVKVSTLCDGATHPFVDVPASSFAFEDIACIFSLDITTGTSPITYSPADDVTREQMGAFLARVYRTLTGKACSGGATPFVDVPASSFAFGDIGCIYGLGITTGTSATTYSPADSVTREQMAAFIARLYRIITGDDCTGGATPFVDVPVSSFAFGDIGCIFNLGITTGTSATTYSPADFVTREQIAAFIARLVRLVC